MSCFSPHLPGPGPKPEPLDPIQSCAWRPLGPQLIPGAGWGCLPEDPARAVASESRPRVEQGSPWARLARREPSYREVGSGGHPVKACPEGLQVVDMGREVPRPVSGEDGLGRPQHPVGLEGLVQVPGQAAAVVDDGTELLHLQRRGSGRGRTPPGGRVGSPGPQCRQGAAPTWAAAQGSIASRNP